MSSEMYFTIFYNHFFTVIHDSPLTIVENNVNMAARNIRKVYIGLLSHSMTSAVLFFLFFFFGTSSENVMTLRTSHDCTATRVFCVLYIINFRKDHSSVSFSFKLPYSNQVFTPFNKISTNLIYIPQYRIGLDIHISIPYFLHLTCYLIITHTHTHIILNHA